jgi:hypothetical protein
MTDRVVGDTAIVKREGSHAMTPGSAIAGGQSFGKQVNVQAMAGIVQAMLAGGGAVLEDGDWLRARAVEALLSPDEHAALEALQTRIRSGATLLKESCATTWYG